MLILECLFRASFLMDLTLCVYAAHKSVCICPHKRPGAALDRLNAACVSLSLLKSRHAFANHKPTCSTVTAPSPGPARALVSGGIIC
jgi:hypothetical protein